MSDQDTLTPEQERNVLAAEFAVGLLSGAELAQASELAATDPGFATSVDNWRRRLAFLGELVTAVSPPAALWHRIEARLPGGQVAPRGLLRRLGVWRLATAGLALATAALLIVALLPAAPGQRFVAVLGEGPQDPRFLVTVDLKRQQVSIAPVASISQPDGDYQLWFIRGETAPKSLGLISSSGQRRLSYAGVAAQDGLDRGLLAISLEPKGGSPTGLPTGPVVYTGPLLPAPE